LIISLFPSQCCLTVIDANQYGQLLRANVQAHPKAETLRLFHLFRCWVGLKHRGTWIFCWMDLSSTLYHVQGSIFIGVGKITPFAIFYSIGTVLSLCSSLFLWGPWHQIKNMFKVSESSTAAGLLPATPHSHLCRKHAG
jgi:hypothetical protein